MGFFGDLELPLWEGNSIIIDPSWFHPGGRGSLPSRLTSPLGMSCGHLAEAPLLVHFLISSHD